ncbi:uncharacterized protein LOC119584914 [Penaeus monodon]|uniref:uncharacterized protein LOC119584914 n=1 Tax=Penaeus monodon TaxID=6687 RepID=UPI0018A6E98D|nr:uncharacterized protein LOC119584914 [Penaeus monodon]
MAEEDGSMVKEIKHRIQCGWNNWRKVSGMISDKRVPVKLKGKVYKSVVRPATTYGLETAPPTKVEERKLDVAEMKMLRWMVGVPKMDCVRNNYIRGSLKVTEISKNVQESRLRWHGHLLRRNEDHPHNEDLNITQINKHFNDIIKESALEVCGKKSKAPASSRFDLWIRNMD